MVYISYQLAEYQRINLVLHDSVRIEVMNEKQDMGEHLISLQTDGLQTGLYYVIMSLKGEQFAEKLIISR
jgi:hypothetical protein